MPDMTSMTPRRAWFQQKSAWLATMKVSIYRFILRCATGIID